MICNGTNERQNVAITDEVEIRLKRDFGIYPNSVEGRRQGEWILMDYVDFIVHVFSAEKRQYYGLERLRKSATTVSPDDLNAELKAQIRATREKVKTEKAEKKTATKKPAVKKASSKTVAGQAGKPAPVKRGSATTEAAAKTARKVATKSKK